MLVKNVITYVESIHPIILSGNTCIHLCTIATRRRQGEESRVRQNCKDKLSLKVEELIRRFEKMAKKGKLVFFITHTTTNYIKMYFQLYLLVSSLNYLK